MSSKNSEPNANAGSSLNEKLNLPKLLLPPRSNSRASSTTSSSSISIVPIDRDIILVRSTRPVLQQITVNEAEAWELARQLIAVLETFK